MSIRIDGTNTAANPGITGADADTGLQFGTDEIQLVTGGTNRATVESNGNFTIEDGNLVVAAGHGIDFSATGNATGMTSELLDDYEEGSWTPTTVAYSGTLSISSANYIKIGNLCFVHAYIDFSNTTDGSVIIIAGLPFTVAGPNNRYYMMTTHTNGGLNELHLRAQGTTDRMNAVHLSSSNGDAKPTYTSSKSKFFIFSGCYTTV